jgi:hypothetical protein
MYDFYGVNAPSGYHVSDRADSSIEIGRGDVSSRDVLLSRLNNCDVKILASPSTVHIADLDNCRILCGPVRTSVFVEKCKQVCQQDWGPMF